MDGSGGTGRSKYHLPIPRKARKRLRNRQTECLDTLCNQQVGGSSPSTSSKLPLQRTGEYGGIPEWPKGADCKSVVSDFGGSNPPSPTKKIVTPYGVTIFLFERRADPPSLVPSRFPAEQHTEKHLDHKLMEIAALFCQVSCDHPYHITRNLLCQE